MAELQLFGTGLEKIFKDKTVDLDDGNVKVFLTTVTWSPNFDTDAYYSSVTNELTTAGGYTAGGQALVSPTFAYVPAGSATAWVTGTAYQLGDIVRKVSSNGHIYMCVAAGTSGGAEPTWTTTRGATQPTDGSVTWVEAGKGYLKFDANDPSWANATFTCQKAGYYYNTGTAATSPLIGAVDFGSSQSPSNAAFTIQLDATGIFVIPVR